MEQIASRKNQKVIHMKKLGMSRDYRRECGEYICDGEKLLCEAIKHGAEVTAVMVCGEMSAALPGKVPVFEVAMDIIGTVSPLKNPQSIVFSCKIPSVSDDSLIKGRSIVLEGIQDPGNVGTIIRTANAFNYDRVILIGGCADPYNPKTIRAAMGAVFRQRIVETDMEGIRKMYDSGIKFLGAAMGINCRDIRETDLRNSAVVIGSEGRGLSENMLRICEERIMIPMNPDCESLNAAAAAAVIMWEAGKIMPE